MLVIRIPVLIQLREAAVRYVDELSSASTYQLQDFHFNGALFQIGGFVLDHLDSHKLAGESVSTFRNLSKRTRSQKFKYYVSNTEKKELVRCTRSIKTSSTYFPPRPPFT